MVAGKPFLSHVLEGLSKNGIKDISILVGWKANKIKEYYQDGSRFGLNIDFLEQKERMGTAHAIGIADGHFDEPFMCVNGDVVIFDSDIGMMLSKHHENGSPVIGAVEVSDPQRFGVLETVNGKLDRIVEKPSIPTSNLINAGVFVFDPEIFDQIRRTEMSPRGEYEITDTLNALAKKKDVLVQPLKEGWIDVGRPWDLLRANEILMSRIARSIDGEVEPGAVLKGQIVVEKGAIVRSGSYIEGPVYISEGCDIGPNCYIRAYTSLGPRCRVGASVEVKNSIVMAGTHVPHHNYVGDSILGERCNLGAGTKVANLRFDDRTVQVSFQEDLINTGRRKMGVIMGDDVKTGINSMIDAGTIIYEGSIIGPGAVVRGSIGPGSKVL